MNSWRPDVEDFAALRAMQSPMPTVGYCAPTILDPREIIQTENQGWMGSCRGHSLSTGAEWLAYIARGERIQLSRLWAYLMTQKIDGIRGDNGATIGGGIKLLFDTGLPHEETVPYPNPVRYPNGGWKSLPSNDAKVLEEASNYRGRKAIGFKSIEEVDTFINGKLGYIDVGCAWGSCFESSIVTSYSSRGSRGGHAWCILPVRSDKTDSTGMLNFWMHNSHGKGWGVNGWKEITATAVWQLIKDRSNAVVGVSDMVNPTPRDFKWAEHGLGKNRSVIV